MRLAERYALSLVKVFIRGGGAGAGLGSLQVSFSQFGDSEGEVTGGAD